MKTKIFLGCMMTASLLTVSCADLLQEDPQGKLTPENYFSTQEELNMSVYSLYSKVNASQTRTNPQYPQWQGDDITTNPGSNKQAAAEIDRFAPVNSNKGVKDCWADHYAIIKAANFIIQNASKTPTDETSMKQAIGQAKFWRAYAYFTLVRIFGDIPLTLDNENDDFTMTPSPVEKVYEQIVADLTSEECESLPESYKDAPAFLNGVNVYVTKAALQSTRAAVYMAMAGWPLEKGASYYAKAAEEAKKVIEGAQNGTYDIRMDDNYYDVYAMSNNYNKETILGINYSPNVDWVQDSQLTSCNQFESIGGWGDAWGEIRFWKRFPEGPRKDAIYDPQILKPNKDGKGYELHDWYEKSGEGWVFPECHPMFSVFSVNWDPASKANIDAPYDYTLPASQNMCNGHRHRLIRYAEVKLWYAEAAARAGEADLTLARQCLKDVRKRGMVGDTYGNKKKTYADDGSWKVINGVDIDQMNASQLAEAAFEEHGWEVAGYWVALVTRRADQFRMKLLQKTFEERVGNPEVEVAPGVKVKEGVEVSGTWSDSKVYMPYPDTDSAKNPNL